MDAMIITIVAVLVALGLGTAGGFFGRGYVAQRNDTTARSKASHVVAEAEETKKRLVLQGQEEALKLRTAAEQELRDRRTEVQRQERRISQRDEQLIRRSEALEKRERAIGQKERDLEDKEAELEEFKAKQQAQLEAISGLSMNDAKDLLMRRAEEEIQYELARRYRDMQEQAKEEADQKARRIVTLAIHRLASDVVSENTTAVVPLPNDEMKGRLIGREGRNIRAIEAATGVDLIIDDTPEAVTISCFDPIRREVAKLALTLLIQDGRIHPARIEDMVKRAEKEVDETIWKEGERAVFETGVRGMNPELIKLLGRLKYRYSYGENILQHSIEVSHLAGMLAAECGANVEIAKVGGLLHDIGKALTHEVEGTHAEIGADVARKYGITEPIWRAIMEHHDEEMGSTEAFLVAAADAISAARPGARRDTLEHYVKRLEALEAVANAFPGIEKTFAIQAGREVRIMVKPEVVDDVAAASLARNVVKKIEDTLVYPGQIKVMVIRETRNVEFAK
ncbi:MAG: ribonuclease Y [Chloroflexi bacterium]|nr:ribonuclease Y [Chloroflexota bacterium]